MARIEPVPARLKRCEWVFSHPLYVLANNGTRSHPVKATVIAVLTNTFRGKGNVPKVSALIKPSSITDG